MKMKLNRLQKVELRDVWSNEATDFTPWLADKENIRLLGQAIDLDLVVEGQEESVGPFRADILCRELSDDSMVLIENQLERTDHKHLGQLLTYAAGLDAVTIVWVAQRFAEEHRAALDWLNEMTSDDVALFGLEIELWKIGDSDVAPKFNVVSSPNEWTRTLKTKDKNFKHPERMEYWLAFHEYIAEHAMELKPRKADGLAALPVRVGWKKVWFKVGGYTDHDHVFTRLIGHREFVDQIVESLMKEKEAIEGEYGGTVFRKGKVGRDVIQVNRPGAIAEKDKWDEDFRWYVSTIRKLTNILGDRIEKFVMDEG